MNIYKYIIKGGLAQMYKSRRTIFVFLLALVLILGVLPEFHVRAEDNSQTYKVGADDHTLWDRVQDGVFQYAAGSMEIEGAGLQGDAAQADVAAGTEITINTDTGQGLCAEKLYGEWSEHCSSKHDHKWCFVYL